MEVVLVVPVLNMIALNGQPVKCNSGIISNSFRLIPPSNLNLESRESVLDFDLLGSVLPFALTRTLEHARDDLETYW